MRLLPIVAVEKLRGPKNLGTNLAFHAVPDLVRNCTSCTTHSNSALGNIPIKQVDDYQHYYGNNVHWAVFSVLQRFISQFGWQTHWQSNWQPNWWSNSVPIPRVQPHPFSVGRSSCWKQPLVTFEPLNDDDELSSPHFWRCHYSMRCSKRVERNPFGIQHQSTSKG